MVTASSGQSQQTSQLHDFSYPLPLNGSDISGLRSHQIFKAWGEAGCIVC